MRVTGRFMLFLAAVFLLLFLANLRSRMYYHAPNYSFLLFMFFTYCGLTGGGLLNLRKWAVILLFAPGVLSAVIFAYGWRMGERVPMPWALVNYLFLATLFVVPYLLLRNWHRLHW